MEIKPNQLKNIFVSYRDNPAKDFSTPDIKKEFNKFLGSHPLSSINSIHVSYKLNEKHRLELDIKHSNSEYEWNVHIKNELFFSFPFKDEDEKDFIKLFEEQLNQELEKKELEEWIKNHPYSDPPSAGNAGLSMDGL